MSLELGWSKWTNTPFSGTFTAELVRVSERITESENGRTEYLR